MSIVTLFVPACLSVPETDDETTEQKDEQFEKEEIKGT